MSDKLIDVCSVELVVTSEVGFSGNFFKDHNIRQNASFVFSKILVYKLLTSLFVNINNSKLIIGKLSSSCEFPKRKEELVWNLVNILEPHQGQHDFTLTKSFL